jgi:Uma2 family endonuclease
VSTARTRRPFTRLSPVTYDAYVRLRDDPAYDGKRMAYHDGVLEIMSPEYIHETGAARLAALVVAYCEAFDVDYEDARSTTFRRGVPGQPKGSGNEPDQSYYLRDAVDAVVGKERLDLAVDQPPSLWIEVENTNSAVPRLPLYARLEIPEVWRYSAREHTLWFGRLAGGGYEEVPASVALPGLTPAAVLGLLAHGRTSSTAQWVRWLKNTWFPEHRQELLDAGAAG